MEPPKVLTVAGSDSGGAAGLQADLKTFSALGVYGMCAITAVTAQNSVEVRAVQWLPPSFVLDQLEAVVSDYGATAAKTGFIGRAAVVAIVAGFFEDWHPAHLVVDPILVNHRGEAMFSEDVSEAYRRLLFPIADLVTPNIAEAALLVGRPIHDLTEAEEAAREIQDSGPTGVLITGITQANEMADLLLSNGELMVLRGPRLKTINTHGSGDALSAAVCASLAKGEDVGNAVKFARRFTIQAIERGAEWRLGQGHGPLGYPP